MWIWSAPTHTCQNKNDIAFLWVGKDIAMSLAERWVLAWDSFQNFKVNWNRVPVGPLQTFSFITLRRHLKTLNLENRKQISPQWVLLSSSFEDTLGQELFQPSSSITAYNFWQLKVDTWDIHSMGIEILWTPRRLLPPGPFRGWPAGPPCGVITPLAQMCSCSLSEQLLPQSCKSWKALHTLHNLRDSNSMLLSLSLDNIIIKATFSRWNCGFWQVLYTCPLSRPKTVPWKFLTCSSLSSLEWIAFYFCSVKLCL